jgi:peptidoglycan/xylan/chitin deacetylase (PgdA/CDA1 family)
VRRIDRPHQVAGCRIDQAERPDADDFVLCHAAEHISLRVTSPTALVWSLCDGQRTIDDIISLLTEAYSEGDGIGADVQQLLASLTEHSAVEWLATEGYDIPILVYHKVAEAPPPGNTVWISRRLFAEQLAALSAHGYVTVSFQDYLAYRSEAATPPPRPVILTFDDGYDSLYTIVRPILNEYGFKATVFLITKYIGTAERMDNHWDAPEAHYGVNMLLWPEVTTLAAEGYAFGSHTQSHPYLTAISETWAEQEIKQSAIDLQTHLGAPPYVFSYPFGDGAGIPHIEGLVQKAGYALAVSALLGLANTLTSDIWALPRIKITEANSLVPDFDRPGDFFLRKLDPR